jgi:MFS transporter, DHA1 family, multidrug resistance protein
VTRRIAVVLLMLFIVFVGFGLIIPVMPVIVSNVGAKAYHFGLMLSAYSVVGFFMSPWWGRLSDKVGRKPIMVVGLFGFSLSFLLFALGEHSLWMMYLSRLVGGSFSGAVTAIAMAYIADVTTPEERTKGMALAGMTIGMGFIFGPGIGGLLSRVSLTFPFYAAAVLAFVNAIWALVALKESLRLEERRPTIDGRSRWEAFVGPLKYLYIVDFVSQFSISTLEGCFQFYQMEKIGATPTQVGLMFLISGFAGAAVQGGIVRRIRHGRETIAMYLGLILSGIGMFSILLSTNFWTATLFMTLFGASNTVIKPTLTSVITKETKVGQGLASGLISSMDSLGRIVGPVFATWLFGMSHSLPFIVTGIVVMVTTLLVYAYKKSSIRERITAQPL